MNNYASLKVRFLAWFFDFLLFLTPVIFALWSTSKSAGSVSELTVSIVTRLTYIVIPAFLIRAFYAPVFISSFGATIGKLLAGIRVISHDGQILDFKKAFFRQTVGYSASSAVLGAGYLSARKDHKKQTWHDQMVSSYVVVVKHNLWYLALLGCVLLSSLAIYLGQATIFNFANNQSLHEDIRYQLEQREVAPEATPAAESKIMYD